MLSREAAVLIGRTITFPGLPTLHAGLFSSFYVPDLGWIWVGGSILWGLWGFISVKLVIQKTRARQDSCDTPGLCNLSLESGRLTPRGKLRTQGVFWLTSSLGVPGYSQACLCTHTGTSGWTSAWLQSCNWRCLWMKVPLPLWLQLVPDQPYKASPRGVLGLSTLSIALSGEVAACALQQWVWSSR
jgi:hypothetical protein